MFMPYWIVLENKAMYFYWSWYSFVVEFKPLFMTIHHLKCQHVIDLSDSCLTFFLSLMFSADEYRSWLIYYTSELMSKVISEWYSVVERNSSIFSCIICAGILWNYYQISTEENLCFFGGSMRSRCHFSPPYFSLLCELIFYCQRI